MTKHFSITCVGEDRPGIVSGLTEVLFNLGANIEDSSMTILRGQFAMILIVSSEEVEDSLKFEEGFKGVKGDLGLTISVDELSEDQLHDGGGFEGDPYIISVIGADKPGIVYKLTKLLSSDGINITDMNTKFITSEETHVYIMVIEVSIPAEVDMERLEESFVKLGREMSIEITMREVEVLEL